MSEAFVRIHGIVSKSSRKLLTGWPRYADSCILFFSYSDFDIPAGTIFRYLIENEKEYPIQAELIQITQSWLKPFDEIPRGHKTICEIRPDELSLVLLQSKLPVVDAWGGACKFVLSM